MEEPRTSDPASPLVPSEFRSRVESTCAAARTERARSVAADAALRDARNAAMDARAALDAALATLDERRLTEHKDMARRAYRLALSNARHALDRQRAAATWLRQIDELNRSSRTALGQVLLLRSRCEALDQTVRDTSVAANVQRVRAESADAACVQARQRLAEHDRWAAQAPGSIDWPGLAPGSSMAGTHRTNGPAADPVAPRPAFVHPGGSLAIELLLAGDPDAARQTARQMADLTGQQPSRCLMLLQRLAETIVDSAIDHGHLRFDRSDPLWAQLSDPEARALTRALRDLGFRYDPADGWYGDRAPKVRDLALALAYAGMDAHALRHLSTNEELLQLPASITVAPFQHLAEMAPDLTLEDVHHVCERHAQELSDLWDHWADVRAVLLAPATLAVEV